MVVTTAVERDEPVRAALRPDVRPDPVR